MKIILEVIGSLVYFVSDLFETFVTSTAQTTVLFLTFISMGLLEVSLATFKPP